MTVYLAAICPRCGHGVIRFPCWQCGYGRALAGLRQRVVEFIEVGPRLGAPARLVEQAPNATSKGGALERV